jgi:hypothetical protein
MHITTLPISYRPGRSFRILMTGFVASSVAKLTGDQLIQAINATSLRDRETVDSGTLLAAYQNDMAQFAPVSADLTFNDKDPGFLHFISNEIEQMFKSGHCHETPMEILHCPCGKVESPERVLHQFVREKRTEFVTEQNGILSCVFCKQPLVKTKQDVFVHTSIETSSITTLPTTLTGRVSALIAEHTGHPIVFSRHARASNSLTYRGKIIDPDYCWLHMFGYLHKVTSETEFCLIAGVDCMLQAVRVVLFTKAHYPGLRITVLFHPLLQLDSGSAINKKTTIQELIHYCNGAGVARTLLVSSLQWSRHYSAVNLTELQTIQFSHNNAPRKNENTHAKKTLQDVLQLLKRDTVIRLLKALRQKRQLNEDETLLLGVLCGKTENWKQ